MLQSICYLSLLQNYPWMRWSLLFLDRFHPHSLNSLVDVPVCKSHVTCQNLLRSQVLHAHSRLKGSRSIFTGVLCLLGCAASSLGLAIGAMFPQGDAALALGPALMIVYVITGESYIYLSYSILNSSFLLYVSIIIVHQLMASYGFVGTLLNSLGAIGPAGLSGDLPYGLDMFRTLSPIRPSCEVNNHQACASTK